MRKNSLEGISLIKSCTLKLQISIKAYSAPTAVSNSYLFVVAYEISRLTNSREHYIKFHVNFDWTKVKIQVPCGGGRQDTTTSSLWSQSSPGIPSPEFGHWNSDSSFPVQFKLFKWIGPEPGELVLSSYSALPLESKTLNNVAQSQTSPCCSMLK